VRAWSLFDGLVVLLVEVVVDLMLWVVAVQVVQEPHPAVEALDRHSPKVGFLKVLVEVEQRMALVLVQLQHLVEREDMLDWIALQQSLLQVLFLKAQLAPLLRSAVSHQMLW
jgi:hypothetical protein